MLELVFVEQRRILPTCLISVLEGQRSVVKGCQAYLAYVTDTKVIELNSEEVPYEICRCISRRVTLITPSLGV